MWEFTHTLSSGLPLTSCVSGFERALCFHVSRRMYSLRRPDCFFDGHLLITVCPLSSKIRCLRQEGVDRKFKSF